MTTNDTDFFRDTWARYLGYANEVGESFRAIVPVKIVRASYAVAFAYVLADTGDKSLKMIRSDGRPRKVLNAAGDALIWQTFASVIVPGLAINRICAYSRRGLKNYLKVPSRVQNVGSVVVGLASIPVIVHPIDKGVSILMDLTYRRWYAE